MLTPPHSGVSPNDPFGFGIEKRDRVDFAHRDQELSGFGERECRRGRRVDVLHRVRVHDVAQKVSPDHIEKGFVVRPDEGCKDRDFLALRATARDDRDRVIYEWRLDAGYPGKAVLSDRLGEDIDLALRTDRRIVVGVLRQLPQHVRILVEFCESEPVRCAIR